MATNLLDESKIYLPNFYDCNKEEWLENPSFKMNGREVEKSVIEFLIEYYHLLLDSSILNWYSIIWLKSNLGSVRKTFLNYNEANLEIDKVNLNTAQSNLTFSKNKLKESFWNTMLSDVIIYPEKYLTRATELLDKALLKYTNDKEYKDKLIIKVPKNYSEKELSEKDWNQLLDTLSVFSVEMKEKIEQGKTELLTPDMIGYYNFLISHKQLDSIDEQRLKKLNNLLKIGK